MKLTSVTQSNLVFFLIQKENLYWLIISDLVNLLSHKAVAMVLLQNENLVEIWFELISYFQVMNLNVRKFGEHVQQEQPTYFSSFSAELEFCSSVLWSFLQHLKGNQNANLSKKLINLLMINLRKWLTSIDLVSSYSLIKRPNSKHLTFHLPLHRYFSAFIYNSKNSIDENAIQNLSFIVNITKNIQLNAASAPKKLTQQSFSSTNKDENSDAKELANYFPSFLWVIRDFALKLVDAEGSLISSKEYLEKALEAQSKGFSESSEQKNKIRTLLKDFFRERNCITLVRPLTEESNLQNLDKMDLSQLRPEFSEQVNNLRKIALKQIKPKTLNGKQLNGEMFCNMIKCYVEAINQGAVPVIENAWGFMCKNECAKAMKNSAAVYEKYVTENFSLFNSKKTPNTAQELRKIHVEAKDKAIESFKRYAIGNFFDEYLLKLKIEIRQKQQNFQKQNESETEKACMGFLLKNYSDIEKNINQGSYKNIADFSVDIEDFLEYFKKAAPQGPNREIHLYSFLLKNVLEATEAFYKQNLSELEISKCNNAEIIKRLQAELSELKTESEKELNSKSEIIKKYEKEKSELVNSDKLNKENLVILGKEKEQLNKNLSEKLENVKKELDAQVKELKKKLLSAEEDSQEAERSLKNKAAEFLKEKSLLEQKLKYSEKQIEDLSSKEKDQLSELKSIKKDRELFSKDSKEKFEAQIKSLYIKIEELQDKNIDLETKLLDKEKRSEIERKKHEESLDETKKKLEDYNAIINLTEDEYKLKEKRQLDEFEKQKIEFEFKLQEQRFKQEELERKGKDQDDKFSSLKTKNQKEISMLTQELEFTKSSFLEYKTQMETEKNNLQAMITLLEDKNLNQIQSQEGYIKQINELKNDLYKQMKGLEEESEKTKTRLNLEIEELQKKYFETENEKIFVKENFEKIKSSSEQKISELENTIKCLSEKLAKAESQLALINEEHKLSFESLGKQSHDRIEELLRSTRLEIEQSNIKSEKSISEMQKFFEAEKANIEYKLVEEKEKYCKKLSDQEAFYVEKFKEIEETKSKKIEELEEELGHLDAEHHEYTIRTEQDLSLKTQQIEDLERFFNEQKENLINLQQAHKLDLEKQLESHLADKKNLSEKAESLNLLINKLEKENAILQVQKEYLEADIETLKADIASFLAQSESQKSNLTEKYKSYEEKYKAIYDDLLIKTGDYSRDLALKKQEVEFLEKKLLEQQVYIDVLSTKNDENLRMIREGLEAEYAEKLKSLYFDKEFLEKKLSRLQVEFREAEDILTKEKTIVEKEKAVLNEKLNYANLEKQELINSLEKEREMRQKQLQELKDQNKAENELKFKENEFLKNKLNKIEAAHNELMSNYENDMGLWENKNKHLEEKLLKSKQDVNDSNKKYEQIIELLQKQGLTEKEKFETWQNLMQSQIESRYMDQIKLFKENYQKAYEEVQGRKREMESEIKSLQEKLQADQKSKLLDQGELGKRLQTALESEALLKVQIQELAESKERKVAEVMLLLGREREAYKIKIIEQENKLREYESKRSNLAVDNLKEKVNYDKEKENLLNEIETLKERIVSLERSIIKFASENKDLVRDNDRLKRDNRNVRSTNFLPKFSRYATNSKDSRNPNSSFDKSQDGMDFMKNLSSQNINNLIRNKFATRSEKSEEENISSLSNI